LLARIENATFRFLFDSTMRTILNIHIRVCEEMARILVEDWKGTTSLSSTF